jgi:glutamate synthase (NADPH/NADH) small chain
MLPVADSEFMVDTDLILLAMGFSGVEGAPWLDELGVGFERGVVSTPVNQATRVPGVFAAGDSRRGASLIVWAIREGRDAAEQIDQYLREPADRAEST